MILHPTIYKDDTGEVWLERDKGFGYFIHMYAYEWSKDSYNHYKRIWKIILQELSKAGISEVNAAAKLDDEKLIKFASKFGFKITDNYILDTNGDIRRVMKCQIS